MKKIIERFLIDIIESEDFQDFFWKEYEKRHPETINFYAHNVTKS